MYCAHTHYCRVTGFLCVLCLLSSVGVQEPGFDGLQFTETSNFRHLEKKVLSVGSLQEYSVDPGTM